MYYQVKHYTNLNQSNLFHNISPSSWFLLRTSPVPGFTRYPPVPVPSTPQAPSLSHSWFSSFDIFWSNRPKRAVTELCWSRSNSPSFVKRPWWSFSECSSKTRIDSRSDVSKFTCTQTQDGKVMTKIIEFLHLLLIQWSYGQYLISYSHLNLQHQTSAILLHWLFCEITQE